MNNKDRFFRLNNMIADNLIIRNEWTDKDEQGRERACLLAALSPEVAEERNASVCPASLMPTWLAYLTVWMDDSVSNAYWPEMVKEYAWMIQRIHLLSQEKLNGLYYKSKLLFLQEIKFHTFQNQHEVLKVIDDVLLLLKKASSGIQVSEEKWEKAKQICWVIGSPAFGACWAAQMGDYAALKVAQAGANVAFETETCKEKNTDRMVKKMFRVFRREIMMAS